MFLWTSEAVSAGHPDKVADQIADSILDAHLTVNHQTRCGCEVTCCKDLVLVTGGSEWCSAVNQCLIEGKSNSTQ